MSVLNKNWIIINEDKNLPIKEKILKNRGFENEDDIENFLYPENINFYDPFLFKDMEKAVNRVKESIEGNERIIVFGDYDVDGISATAIMFRVLEYLNANVSYRLPKRLEDGYGLSESFINDFEKKAVKLLITVDCGISCRNEIKLAQTKSIDVIVTDHHTVPENFPEEAYAVIHPKLLDSKYPFKELTGAGVAFKFAEALLKYFKKENHILLNGFLDFAALGTVADLGPLVDENRLIVKKGLQNLKNTIWPGLRHLKKIAGIDEGKNLNTVSIGYFLAPRINAAGRIDNPYFALQLLLEEENENRSELLARKLEEINKTRQSLTEKGVKEAIDTIEIEKVKDNILILDNPNWHVGIIGLIAGKLVEKYNKPSIIMQDFGDILVASGRSTESFNIIEALTENKQFLEQFGGHAEAAGFNILKEKLEPFKKAMTDFANLNINDEDVKPILKIDCEINEKQMNDELFSFIDKCAPFGVRNPKPKFLLKNVIPSHIKRVGKEEKHLKFDFYINNKNFQVIGFNFGQFSNRIIGKQIDLVCEIDKDVWNGFEKLELKAVDFEVK